MAIQESKTSRIWENVVDHYRTNWVLSFQSFSKFVSELVFLELLGTQYIFLLTDQMRCPKLLSFFKHFHFCKQLKDCFWISKESNVAQNKEQGSCVSLMYMQLLAGTPLKTFSRINFAGIVLDIKAQRSFSENIQNNNFLLQKTS